MTRARYKTVVWLSLLLLIAARAGAVGTPIPEPPRQYVTDTAGFLSPGTARGLSARLENYARTTGHQVVVWIGRTTGGVPIEEWAVKAFEKWRVGRKGLDDGVLLVIMADDRKLRFEVGYGLEGDVTDLTASRIIREQMVPRMQQGDRDGAVTAGVDALLKVIGGEAAGAGGSRQPRAVRPQPGPSLGQTIMMLIFGAVVLFFIITNPALAMSMLWALSAGGRGGRGGWHGGGGGGWGGGGGGFSGGGGRSGGGGASGSW